MRRAVLAALAGLVLVTAGCLADDASRSDPASSEAGSGPVDGSPSPPASDGASANDTSRSNATLQEPPEWRVGDWWTVEVTGAYTGETHTVTQVVTGRHGSTYHVGLAADDLDEAAIVAGWPPVGEVRARDLSFRLHGERFQPLTFPLEEGATWTTAYEGQAGYKAQVVSAGGTTAEVGFSRTVETAAGSFEATMNLTYDAEVRAVTKVEDPSGRTVQVTDHGTGFEGRVLVPHGRAQYLSGRVVGVFDGLAVGTDVATPSGSLRVAEPAASVALLVGSASVAGAAPPGFYQEVASPPARDALELSSAGTDGLTTVHVHVDEAAGTWTFRHVAGGFGAAATEIVAYEPLWTTLDGGAAGGGS